MAAPIGRTPDGLIPLESPPPSKSGESAPVAHRLAHEPYSFDFFQAVRLLEILHPEAAEVGYAGPVDAEPVRFSAHPSTSFPPSAIADLSPPKPGDTTAPTMTVSFFGLIGPKGVLPQHYTEEVMRLEVLRAEKKAEKGALRAWLDIFNHRLTGLFYRAWEKYRFAISYERTTRKTRRGVSTRDNFTLGLLSLVGLGTNGLRDRLGTAADPPAARIDDEALLYYAGILARKSRNATGLESILQDFFGHPVEVKQFQGQWLALAEGQQTRLGGGPGSRNALGREAVAGARVWNLQSKVRIRIGPIGYADFRKLLPDPERPGALMTLSRLARFYLGPDLDFDVQLILHRSEIPSCRMGGDGGAVLGWNSWIASNPLDNDSEDAIFPEIEPRSSRRTEESP